jgi:ferrous-iron efflux pump FieF
MPPENVERRQSRAARIAVTVALTLAATKLATGLYVNSVAVLASAMDSLLDVLASWLNLMAIRVSHAPPDEQHRFGHHKAEALATAGQALLIGGSAVYLVIEGARRVATPQEFRRPGMGLVMMGAAALTSALLVLYLRRVAGQTNSAALRADATHYSSDVLANLAILLGFGVASVTGWHFLDGILTIAVAFYVGASAFKLLRDATGVLMDEEIPASERERLAESIKPFLGRIQSWHGLRTRMAGHRIFVEIHLEMDGDMALQNAHDLGVEVEHAIKAAFPDAQVLVHLDVEDDEPPIGDEVKLRPSATPPKPASD